MTRSENEAFYEVNRARWDESVPIHVASKGYDLPGFLAGEKSLFEVETSEVGDVAGKALLHLQCHFGMDTLNWARLGAKVTGLDFSGPAIAQARELAAEIGIHDATFVEANLYDARSVIQGQFDVVYTGIGALCWLHDIREWAQIAASFVKPGGFLYVYEGHPMLWALDDARDDGELVLSTSYFETPRPNDFEGEYTYVDGPALQNTATFEWNHGIGEIVTAVVEAGLRLDFLHEHREVAWKALPHMEPLDAVPDGSGHARRTAWRLPESQRDYCPLMYSLKASRPA